MTIKICQYCEKEFEQAGRNQKFCSIYCREKKYGRRKENINVCVICNESFSARVSHKITCSEECKKSYEKQRQQQWYIEKYGEKTIHITECEICGKSLEESGLERKGRAKYCSAKCMRRSEYNKKPIYDKTCEGCGKIFQTKRKETKYCSGRCINLYYREYDYNPSIIKKCKNCNKEMEIPFHRRTREFCSKSCARSGEFNCAKQEEVREKISLKSIENHKNGVYPDISGENNPMYGRRFTEEQKKDMSLKNMGENNPNWKGGNIKYCSRIREMPEYFSWIIDVYDRDGKQCQICKTIKGSFNVDHIVPFSYIVRKNNLTTVLEAKECEELWDINNGRVLCVECHRKTDTYAGKASSYKE